MRLNVSDRHDARPLMSRNPNFPPARTAALISGSTETAGVAPELRRALSVLAFGALLTLGAFALPQFGIFTKVVPACAVGVAILIYPMLGLVIAFLLSGLSQLAVLIPDFFSFSKLVALFSAIGYLGRSTLAIDLRRAWKSKALVTYALPALWFSFTALVGEASITDKLSRVFNMVAVLALAFLVCSIPIHIREMRRTILAIVMGCGILGLWIVFFGASGRTAQLYDAVDGVTVYYDHNFAIQLGLGLCLSWALLKGVSKAWSITVLAVDVLLVFCLLLTHSRSAWLGVMVSGFLSLFWIAINGGVKRVAALSSAIVAIALVVLVLLQLESFAPVVQLVMPRVEFSMSDPTTASTGRFDYLWPKAIAFIREHPLIGAGLASSSSQGAAHNALLESGVEGGLIGILLYLVSVRYTAWNVARSKNLWLGACGIAVGVFVVTVSQTNPSTFYSMPYGFVVGLVAWMEIHHGAQTGISQASVASMSRSRPRPCGNSRRLHPLLRGRPR